MTATFASTVRSVHAQATLAEPAPELRRARAQAIRGDRAWRRRLERYEQGDTLIVALTAHAVIQDAAATQPEPPCHYCHEAVWIDRATAPRTLTDRLRALARRDFTTVAAALRDPGIAIGTAAGEEQIAVELSIDPAVSAQLSALPDHNCDRADGPGNQR